MPPAPSCITKRTIAWSCLISSTVMLLFNVVFLTFGFPTLLQSTIQSYIVIDSQEKFDKTLGQVMESRITQTFYNLTNAHDLMYVTPAPKPIFKEVVVEYAVKMQAAAAVPQNTWPSPSVQ
jgi:hypothetical protein